MNLQLARSLVVGALGVASLYLTACSESGHLLQSDPPSNGSTIIDTNPSPTTTGVAAPTGSTGHPYTFVEALAAQPGQEQRDACNSMFGTPDAVAQELGGGFEADFLGIEEATDNITCIYHWRTGSDNASDTVRFLLYESDHSPSEGGLTDTGILVYNGTLAVNIEADYRHMTAENAQWAQGRINEIVHG